MCLRRFLTSCSRVLLWKESLALCRSEFTLCTLILTLPPLVLSTGKLSAQPWHHMFLQLAVPPACPDFWLEEHDREAETAANFNLKVHSMGKHFGVGLWWVAGGWVRGFLQEVSMCDVIWIANERDQIGTSILNHARRRGEDFRIGTLWAAAPMPRNNPAAPASARPWKLRIWRALWPLLGIIDRFEVGC